MAAKKEIKSELKCLCKLTYTKNKATIEAGIITTNKGIAPKEDRFYLLLKRGESKTFLCMRDDEMLALSSVISFALWKDHK
jgi:hypothetical protein